MALVDFASGEALLQKRPDGFVVFGTEREVAASPFRTAQPFDKLMSFPGFPFTAGSGERDFFIGTQTFGQLAKLIR